MKTFEIKNPAGFSFDPEKHIYRVGNIIRPGINECLESVGLKPSLSAIPADVLEFARTRGKAIHAVCELYDRGHLGQYEIDPRTEVYLEAWKSFRMDWSFDPEIIEQPMAHPVYQFAGTPDRAGTVEGKPSVVEIKTVSGEAKEPDEWVGFQLAGQAVLLEGCAGYEAGYRYAVCLGSDGKYVVEEYIDRTDKSIFLAAVSITAKKINLYGRSSNGIH